MFNAYVLFIVLVICYCSYLVVFILYFIRKAGELYLGLLLSSPVVFLNSALNPLLYCCRIREVRLVVLRTFRKLFSREWETKTLSFTFNKFASWTKIAIEVKRPLFSVSYKQGQTFFFHTTVVHSVSALELAMTKTPLKQVQKIKNIYLTTK